MTTSDNGIFITYTENSKTEENQKLPLLVINTESNPLQTSESCETNKIEKSKIDNVMIQTDRNFEVSENKEVKPPVVFKAYSKKKSPSKEEQKLLERLKYLDSFLKPLISKTPYSFPLMTKTEEDVSKSKYYLDNYSRKKDAKKMVNFKTNEGLIWKKRIYNTESNSPKSYKYLQYGNKSQNYSENEMYALFESGFNKMKHCYNKVEPKEINEERRRLKAELVKRASIRVPKIETSNPFSIESRKETIEVEKPSSWSETTKKSFENMLCKNIYRFPGDKVKYILNENDINTKEQK